MEKVKIKFGTDGFRGIIAREFTFETLKRIINAINLYIKHLNIPQKTIIIGYDPRFMAKDFAEYASELLKGYGYRVILSSKIVPTPIVAYCAKYYPDSIGAIMLTASHNPPNYQGIKFIPNYAGPATKEITDKILTFLDKETYEIEDGEIIEQDLSENYFKHIENLIDFNIIRKNAPKILFDGLYSSSIGYFDELLKRNSINFETVNMYHDPLFGGGLPEPKPKFLKHNKEGYITFANDGDADRYGVIDETGNYVHPNTILAMLLKYLVYKGYQGKMIKTVGVSNLVEVIAKKLNIETLTTPVGFKWLSEGMRENQTILAGEDSGGLSTGKHIPEKDGIYANLLILEMISKENKPLFKLVQEIKDFAGCNFITDRIDITLDSDDMANNIMNKFNSFSNISNYKVKDKLTIDGVKLFLDDSLTSLLIRKSGTEPLLRFYIESDNIKKLDKIKEFIEENT